MRLRAVRIAAHTLAITALALLSADSGQAAPAKAARSKAAPRARPSPPPLSAESRKCVTCHSQKTPGIVAQWKGSRHAAEAVGCFECHGAGANEAGAFEHEGETIATVLTPNACSGCHGEIVAENQRSHHADAAKFIGSLDNVLGEVVEGRLAAVNGCWQCHGSTVAILKNPDGSVRKNAAGAPMLDPATWPNTGIGRVNLDGSRGACSACHSRHAFSGAMARQPEVCGKCHLGPDHPQAEIYDESKHGIAFRTQKAQMNLDSKKWVVGVDYTAAPTCSTCHMSATPKQAMTHDVGARISWTLRPVLSKKLENWEAKRAAMKEVCGHCHGSAFVDSFYRSFDDTVDLWNTKFAQPAQSIMDALREAKKLTPTPFDEEVEWTFYRLWHHEGRRARMGASMQGPDFTQWHGFFEVAENFYTRFLPQAKEAAHGDEKVLSVIQAVENDRQHAWRKGLSPEERQKIDEFYKERYGKN
ncbi:MAG TPA: multiheme c-type cytochrome [Thermoanaerobaculia bacterium]|nr:multiheme c-type cytochrome [Thermoanaerobaculia bacterium]